MFLAGLLLTGSVGWELHREALVIDRKRFELRMEEVMDQLDGRVEKTQQMLEQLQDTLAFGSGPKDLLFREWQRSRGLSYNFPWLCGLLVATNVEPSAWRGRVEMPTTKGSTNWPALEAMAARLPLECRVAWTMSTRRKMQYLDDYDLRGSHEKGTNGSHAFSKAAWSAGLRISGRQTVMHDAQGRPVPGILFLMPIRGLEMARPLRAVPASAPDRARAVRWLHLDGMIVAPIDFKALEQAVWDMKESDLGVEIFSSTNCTLATWLNAHDGLPHALAPPGSAAPYLTATKKWHMFGDRFSIFFHTTPLFEAQSPKRLAGTAMVSGVVMTVLTAALVGVLTRSRTRQGEMMAEILEARDALAATQKERERLGHDLHDGAIQSLYAVQLGLTRTAEAVNSRMPDESRTLQETRRRIDEVIAELRRFIQAEDGGAAEVNSRSDGAGTPRLESVLGSIVGWLKPTTSAQLSFEGSPNAADRVNPSQAVALIQIARTALGNAVRHAQARRITVKLHARHGKVHLVVQDDGVGFDAARPGTGGIGLQTMRVRAAEVGATVGIDSAPGQGTTVTVLLPVSDPALTDDWARAPRQDHP